APPEPNSSQAPLHSFVYQGKTYQYNDAEWAVFSADMVQKFVDDTCPRLKSRAGYVRGLYDSTKALNEEWRVTSWFVELCGGAELPAETVIAAAEQAANGVQ